MLAAEPETIWSSQRRPRAIALTRRARRPMRIGRTSFRETPSGMTGRTSRRDALCGSRIWRDLLDGGFCQGIDSDPSAESGASSEEGERDGHIDLPNATFD